MALTVSLRLVAQRIARAVRTYATREGIPRSDYALVGTYDEMTGRISLVLAMDRPADERRWYAEIRQEFRNSFREHPQISTQIGLVIRFVQNLDEVYWDAGIGENDFDMTDLLDRFLSEENS